jgi:hypothetical protein
MRAVDIASTHQRVVRGIREVVPVCAVGKWTHAMVDQRVGGFVEEVNVMVQGTDVLPHRHTQLVPRPTLSR